MKIKCRKCGKEILDINSDKFWYITKCPHCKAINKGKFSISKKNFKKEKLFEAGQLKLF